jgi:hypothetical protein
MSDGDDGSYPVTTLTHGYLDRIIGIDQEMPSGVNVDSLDQSSTSPRQGIIRIASIFTDT